MKTAMSNPDIPLIHRLSSLWKIFRAYHNGIFGNAEDEIKFHNKLLDVFSEYVGTGIEKAKILEVGCGRTAVQTALFKADGADSIGIDMEIPIHEINLKTMLQVIKTNGSERAIKSFLRHVLYDKSFFSELAMKYKKPVLFDCLDVRVMSAASMSFPDDRFDFVFSAWVFEYIEDVPEAVKEINRVLRREGIAYIAVHLFPSISGGHHMDWIDPDNSPSEKVPPWDHCLDNNYPVNAYLNKLTINQYRNIFSKYTNVIEEQLTQEGEKYLTPELEEELSRKGYTKEDLLTRTITFLCRKKT